MSDLEQQPVPSGADGVSVISMRSAELAVALLTAIIGVCVMVGSYQAGIGWIDTGPESGYFSFYIGLIIVLASSGTMFFALKRRTTIAAAANDEESFIARGPLRHVLAVFIPICLYVVATRLLGMYLASSLFIAWFMIREPGGRSSSWWRVALVSIGAVVMVYLVFERWFNVPLYAGPLVEMLGLSH